jgi:hypothetical protein
MKTLAISAIFACSFISNAFAWGQDGHSIVAEIAQRRLSPDAATAVEKLLGKGHSLASVGSWADDVRADRPNTYNWHFVDIPIGSNEYRPERDCKDDSDKGDCVVSELVRLKNDLRCTAEDRKAEALKFAVHFIADVHQPLHTVLEGRGGNDVRVVMAMAGRKHCSGSPCTIVPVEMNLHAVWDTGLINQTAWSWGSYVDMLENGWLRSDEAKKTDADGGTPSEWALETHQAAQTVWNLVPTDKKLDDNYYTQVAPILDRQLGIAGLRLARFLNEAFASNACPVVATTAPDALLSAQTTDQNLPAELKFSEVTGLPLIYPYHGKILNYDLQEIPATEENVRNILAQYLDGIARQSKSTEAAASLRYRLHQRAEPRDVETILNMRAGELLIENLVPADQSRYRSMLRVIETWAASRKAPDALAVTKNDPRILLAVGELGLPSSDALVTTSVAMSYINQCREEKVPIPPDWGSPEWEFQGVLAPKYTFSAGADGPTEVWAASGRETKGVCMALPRKDLKSNEIVLLGIICQSKETGKACFWDNIDRTSGDRLTGDAVKNMKISSIQDGSMLAENCTNCHRGFNAFAIHPGTTLDIGQKFYLQPDKRYQPISAQNTWGNPGPLVKRGEAPCGSCHEIPALGDDNDTNPTRPSAFCKTVLQKAANLTMPYVGSPAGWNFPRPAYESHIKLLKSRCDPQSVATAK